MYNKNNKKLSTTTLKVFEKLWDEIVFGKFYPGERLVESELMLRFNTYRASIREALHELVNSGLAIHLPNKGVSVLKLEMDEVEKIYALRVEIEQLAIKWLKLPFSEDQLKVLVSIQNTHSKAIQENDFRMIFNSNNDFHSYIYSHCNNNFLKEMIKNLEQKSLTIRFHSYVNKDFLKVVENEHIQIIESIKRNDRTKLKQLIQVHINQAKNNFTNNNRTRHLVFESA
tara:strand:- start:3756 stop:4439 length:684 start_codon:yes stop_codon:yes gene_type:complete